MLSGLLEQCAISEVCQSEQSGRKRLLRHIECVGENQEFFQKMCFYDLECRAKMRRCLDIHTCRRMNKRCFNCLHVSLKGKVNIMFNLYIQLYPFY